MNASTTIKTNSAIRAFFQRRFQLWLQRRLRPSSRQQLNNKRLFIFPSKAGLGFLCLTLLLWLLGTNYENNLVLGLAFFLVALFIVCIFHTFFNLSGLSLQYLHSAPTFLGDDGELLLEVSCHDKQSKENVNLMFRGGSASLVNLLDDHCQQVKLFVPALERGWFNPGRLLIDSIYPLGIIRCWSWLDMDARLLVYPRPIPSKDIPQKEASSEEGDKLDISGSEDFHGFRNYQPGMPTKHIAWKHYARGRGLYSKEYVSYREPRVILDWYALDGLDRETRLSHLCYWVIKLSATEQDYGLCLPNLDLAPGSGLPHKQAALNALALFEWEKASG